MKAHPYTPLKPIPLHHLILDHPLHYLSILMQPCQNLLRFSLVSFEECSETCEVKGGKFGCDAGKYEEVEYRFRVTIEYGE
jgi:hypothetical protein